MTHGPSPSGVHFARGAGAAASSADDALLLFLRLRSHSQHRARVYRSVVLMKARSALLSAAAASVLAIGGGPATAASDTLVYEIVAGWTIHTDRARGFRCFMEARYEGSSMIRLAFDETGERMHLLVGDPVWDTLAAGDNYAATIRFGDASPWSGSATGHVVQGETNRTALRFEIESSGRSAFVEQLMKAHSVDVSYEGGDSLNLSLAGSYQAALKLTECQESMARVEGGGPRPESEPPARRDAFAVSN